MPTASYAERASRVRTYFDETAADAWARLTTDAPVGSIRATVRAGRDRMRRTILDWLPYNLKGRRVYDAGCGTGALAVEAARRGAAVVAVDFSPKLVGLARDRAPKDLTIVFAAGDMTEPRGRFDHVVAMDSLIHYAPRDAVKALAKLAAQSERSVVFTFPPRTAALTVMHAAGRLFPRRDRAPAIEPVSEDAMRRLIEAEPGLAGWRFGRTERIAGGFYISQAMELVRG